MERILPLFSYQLILMHCTALHNRASRRPAAWRWLAAFLLLGTLGSWPGAARAQTTQTQLRANGPKIVDASGQEVILKGMNLGGWMLQEGYMMKPGFGGTQGAVKKRLYDLGQTDAQVEAFYQGWRDNFITKADIDYLAAKGFNCVRLPLHYELFLTASQRALRTQVSKGTITYATYIDSLTSWHVNNRLFTNPSTLEGIRLVDEVLSWAGANGMYVVFDLHAAPGAQGSDTNISDALLPGGNGFWTYATNQEVTNRLWQALATRYQGDPRIAMYDLINEPNNIPNVGSQNGNQRLHDVLQRLLNTVRATGDQHLILLEGNGYGNNYDYMEKRTFTNTANLVYNSHRYDAPAYPLSNDVNASGGSANQLSLIGNLTRFRTDNNVPIWVGETGENTAAWMREAATNLLSVGIGYCHWTLKRFENGPNAALFHINPPYVVDYGTNLGAVLENIKFANNQLNDGTLSAVAPNPAGTVRAAQPPLGKVITLKAIDGGNYLSGENGQLPVNANPSHATAGASEQFAVLSAGNGKVYLRSQGKYVSSENGQQAMTCTRPTAGYWEAFDWIVNADSTITLGGFNGRYVASGGGQAPANCNQYVVSARAAFTVRVVGTALATRPSAAPAGTAYPNPVADRLTYALPTGTRAHTISVADATGRVVLVRSYGSVGAQHTLDTSGLPRGLYVVKLAGEGFAQSFKVSKE